MLLGARKIRWRLCRQQFSLSYTPSIKLNFHALSQPKVSQQPNREFHNPEKNRNISNSCEQFIILYQVDESDDFLPWLERKAGAEISSAFSIGKSANGTSLFASKSITAGDCVLKVPYSVQLAPDNLATELKDLLSDGVGDAAKLAAVVLFEQRMGYVDCFSSLIYYVVARFFSAEFEVFVYAGFRVGPLHSRACSPGGDALHCTIFWSDDELELIRQSSVYQETINQRSQIKKEFFSIRTV